MLSAFGFVLLSILCRTAFYYWREGIVLFSAVNAVLWSMVSAAIFIPLYQSLGFTKAALIGSAIYGLVFLFCFSYLFVEPSLTVKTGGSFVFQDGTITPKGMVQYLFWSVCDVALSVLCLIVLSKVRLSYF